MRLTTKYDRRQAIRDTFHDRSIDADEAFGRATAILERSRSSREYAEALRLRDDQHAFRVMRDEERGAAPWHARHAGEEP